MAEFAELEAVKAELRDLASPDTKERRTRLIKTSDSLDDMVDEVIEVFKGLHPEEWISFEERIGEKRANATKFGEPLHATSEEKNMELRSECWFPTVAIEVRGLKGKKRMQYRDLKGVLAAIYRKHGFEDFPNPQNRAEFLLLKDFKRRYPVFFVASEL